MGFQQFGRHSRRILRSEDSNTGRIERNARLSAVPSEGLKTGKRLIFPSAAIFVRSRWPVQPLHPDFQIKAIGIR
ncbi:unnamed protein product, partial [Nesidiocoris tenuis]